jgi:hypothetical protein
MSDEADTGLTGWVLAAIASIGATLASVIALLYKKLDANNARTIAALEARCDILDKRNDKCEEDRIELYKICAKHETEIGMLKDKTLLMPKRPGE